MSIAPILVWVIYWTLCIWTKN